MDCSSNCKWNHVLYFSSCCLACSESSTNNSSATHAQIGAGQENGFSVHPHLLWRCLVRFFIPSSRASTMPPRHKMTTSFVRSDGMTFEFCRTMLKLASLRNSEYHYPSGHVISLCVCVYVCVVHGTHWAKSSPWPAPRCVSTNAYFDSQPIFEAEYPYWSLCYK